MSGPLILGIETSCDDTGAALLENGKLLANAVNSQDVHIAWGGVVPELASRAHQQQIVPVIDRVFQISGKKPEDLDAIAVTGGPGLMGALLVGVQFAKGLALALDKPLIAVHHLEAHALVHFLEDMTPSFPYLCLLVSGGHTQIIAVHGPQNLEILGQTLDDAVGEAFDKTAKMMGLPYPGGPIMDKLAQLGNPNAFPFPIAQIKNLDFSFSGLKTSVRYFIENQKRNDPEFVQNSIHDLAASIQNTLIQTLLIKLREAAKQTGIKQIALAGGVAANQGLRHELKEWAIENQWEVFIPRIPYCTDNAAMIAMAGHFLYHESKFTPLDFVPFPSGSDH